MQGLDCHRLLEGGGNDHIYFTTKHWRIKVGFLSKITIFITSEKTAPINFYFENKNCKSRGFAYIKKYHINLIALSVTTRPLIVTFLLLLCVRRGYHAWVRCHFAVGSRSRWGETGGCFVAVALHNITTQADESFSEQKAEATRGS